MRAPALCLALAAALAAAAGASHASESLPPGTIVSRGAPPLVPEADGERATAWAEACIAAGRRRVGTRHGGDLLWSGAVALAHEASGQTRARDLLAEAAAAYPPDAPFRALALLDGAELDLARGAVSAARHLLDAVEASAARPAPVDASAELRHRHALLVEHAAMRGGALAVRIAEARGDLDAVARDQTHAAEGLDRLGSPRAVSAWARAARFHARVGASEAALRAVDRALALCRNERKRADLVFWRLHLQHGLLDADGAPVLGTGWPGGSFLDDVHAALRGLRGNPRVGTWLLTLGSRAVTAGRDDVALDLYLLALRDPVLLDRARDDPDLWGGLLVAFPVALRLERFDDAARILDVVAGVADMPRTDVDRLRIALARAREQAAFRPEEVPAPVAPEPAVDEALPSPHRGRLLPHGPPEEEAPRPVETASKDEADDAVPPAWIVLGLCLLVTVLLLVRRLVHAR